MGCAECCIRCLSGVPYASLLATLLLYAGVALFCGGGHEALSSSLAVLDTKFSFPYNPDLTLFTVVDIFQYIIYGLAAAFFLFGILLFTEGFFTSAAIRDNYGDFKTAACGRCISAFFLFLTYVLTLAWLGILAFSALPVYLTYSVQVACNEAAMNITQVCVDLRQFGIIPWNFTSGNLCDEKLLDMCLSQEFKLSYYLYIVACAGAGATVIAMIHFLLVLVANRASVQLHRRLSRFDSMHPPGEQELHDIQSSRSKERLNAYA
uniref:neuronal membrane glycoprotein M6-a isoform X2 n=1 Tax=Myxine glutinosa TaxID=7769 RepID=UPI00358F405B